MSVKAMGLVWDLECPKKYGELMFKPSHKYVLIAYADHADHIGKNIWPAVPTISKKTGLDDRSVQRLTRDLEDIGLLVEDGLGPRGTNKWMLPYNEGGDKLSPVTKCRGDKNEESLGDIPSGDIPSGDKLTPEFKEPEPLNNESIEIPGQSEWEKALELLKPDIPKLTFEAYLKNTLVIRYDGNTMQVATPTTKARDWLSDRMTRTMERQLIGFLGREVTVEFVVTDGVPA